MNKTCVITFFLLFAVNIYSQTYYYKLTKKIEAVNVYTNTAGGQFITFLGNTCYESDKDGISVGNGKLKFEKDFSNKLLIYLGSSYFGNNVKFKFTQDRNLLNVETVDGRIYVYKKQPAPSSVTTCSLIRKKGSSGSGSGYIPINPVTSYDGTYSGTGTTTTPIQNENTTNKRQQTKYTCSLCHGKRRIVKDTYPALYGTKDYQVRCNECGGYFLRSTGHTHITCPQCHGKGYFTTD